MPTKGRFLETLVACIQRTISPSNLVIKSPERFHRDGTQIGEVDITIRGQFGSTSLLVGIECRDRPSEGPQGVPWISSIFGKKTILGIDKMIAVSSTGFVPEAISTAKQLGIDTLAVREVTDEAIDHLMRMARFSLCVQSYASVEYECQVPVHVREVFSGDRSRIQVKDSDRSTWMPLDTFIDRLVPVILEWWDLELEYDTPIDGYMMNATRDAPLSAKIDGTEFEISNLDISFRLWRQVRRGEVLLTACENASSGDVVSFVGVCRSQVDERLLQVFITTEEGAGGRSLKCGVHLLDEHGAAFFSLGTQVQVKVFSSGEAWLSVPWLQTGGDNTRVPRVSIAIHSLSNHI